MVWRQKPLKVQSQIYMSPKNNQKFNGYDYVKSSGGIEEYVLLKNDLSVLVLEDHSAPVATFMVTYKVGSRNEAIGYTGATHLLEHLMFKGSRNFNKEKNTEYGPNSKILEPR